MRRRGYDGETLADWSHVYSGKVRDLYTHYDLDGLVLIVASDRVSAFDHILRPAIPDKGVVLTRMSRWWFGQFPNITNHIAPGEQRIPDEVAERAMLVRQLDMYPVECVVRGYLSGSGWREYQESGTVCGIALPEGLADGDRLPEPLFTPAYKAPKGEHDENITFEQVIELVGEEVAIELRATSLEIFGRASTIAEARGVILADTKFEFGASINTRILTLGDELLTADSSRYWDKAAYDEGRRGVSWDKQGIRDWLAANWDGQGEPPALPPELVELTQLRYAELLDRLAWPVDE